MLNYTSKVTGHPPRLPSGAAATKPSAPTITQMRSVLTPFCAKRDSYALLLLAFDLCVFAAGQWLAVAASHAALRGLGVIVTWAAIVRLFIIGHDACHQAFTSNASLNHAVGRIAFLANLTPYSLWRVGHNVVHHGYNNLRGRDFVWEPKDPAEYLALPPWRRAVERIYRGASGPALYYFVEIWWKKLFFPNRRNMPTSRTEFIVDSALVAAFAALWIGTICAYALAHSAPVWPAVLTAFLLPFLLWNWTMGLVVYLHHTHPKVRWYADKREWLRDATQVSRHDSHDLSPAAGHGDAPHHGTPRAHSPHLDHSLVSPEGRPAAARADMRRGISSPARPDLRHYLECIRACQLYDYERNCWCTFPD